jgi:transposase
MWAEAASPGKARVAWCQEGPQQGCGGAGTWTWWSAEARHVRAWLARTTPRCWVVERGFAWATCFRRSARDDERLATTLAALHFLAFACLLLHRFILLIWSP